MKNLILSEVTHHRRMAAYRRKFGEHHLTAINHVLLNPCHPIRGNRILFPLDEIDRLVSVICLDGWAKEGDQ